MRNRIFNLHLFLSCLFIKSLVQKLLCLVFSWEQSKDVPEPSVGLACPDRPLWVLTHMWHHQGLQGERGANIAGWEGAGPPSLEGQHPDLSCISCLRGSGHSQPRRFLWFRTPRTWHLRGESCTSQRPCHPAFLMCPTDKPSTPATKTSL